MTRATVTAQDDVPRLAYTAQEFSQATGMPESTVHELMRRGELPFKKVGRRKFIPAHAAEAFFDSD